MNRSLRLAVAAGCLVAASGARAEVADERESYSYVRTLDGRATLASLGRGPGEDADLNSPLQQGDRITVEQNARVEVALADRNVVRLGGDTALQLSRVAFSADRDDRTTQLDLDAGEIVLLVTEQALGDDLPELRTPGGTVFVHEPGNYRIRADQGGAVELVVRDGYAELLTDSGSTVVRTGEAAWTTGDRRRPVEVGSAGSRSELERWGDSLDGSARSAEGRTIHVEPELAYAATPLADYGSWVNVDTSWYWRPRVAVGWRPYWQGRWSWTPSGLTWVSNEPWGWVPYHYGTWSFLPGYGWVWRPGRVYSPAWVYWYVGTGWSGWCPTGYYTDYYRSRWSGGFRFGVYGWAGGSWGLYADWNFLPTTRLCARDGGNWRRRGLDLARTEGPVVPRGILTTDTRDLPRGGWDRPDELVRRLAHAPHGGRDGGDLPEVTDFVARRRDLPSDVARAIVRSPSDPSPRRATPLDPEMERRPRRDDAVVAGGWRVRESAAARGGAPVVDRSRRDLPSSDRPSRVVDPSRAETRADQPAGVDRQGWKLRGGWTDRGLADRTAPTFDPRASDRDADPPVRRVVDGVRRAYPSGETPTTGRNDAPVDRGARDQAPLRFREPDPRGGEPALSPGERRWVLPPTGTRGNATGGDSTRSLPAPTPRYAPRAVPPGGAVTTPPSAPRAPQTTTPAPAQGRGRAVNSPPPQSGKGNRSSGSNPPPPPSRGRPPARDHD
jgi:hypothetical protein